MPRKANPALRELKAQVKLLGAHIRETKRVERAAAKAAALAARPPPRPRHVTVALFRFQRMRVRLAEAQQAMATDPRMNALTAGVLLETETSTFAHHINYWATTFADVIGPVLIAWAKEFLRYERRSPCPLPDLNHMNQISQDQSNAATSV
jgi:hypothetical protein